METYLVRIWTGAGPDAPRNEIRGFVEHVGHGEKLSFIGVDQLLARLAIEAHELNRPVESPADR